MATGLHALSDFMVDSSSALHIYDREIDSSERTSLSVLTSHIAPGARVLDLGCGSGAIGRYLAQRDGAGTTVIDGLTISADEARLASPHYRRVEVADLDNARLSDLFPAQGYDAIVCADVLEHIRQSPRVLAECRQLLAPQGRLLLSIPNAGYAGLVAELMAGEFRYRQEGLLDETHVRFFTRRTLMRFLREHGWVDVQGRAYVLYPLAGLAEDLQSSISSVTRALRELEAARLIERRSNGFSKPNQVFLSFPSAAQKCTVKMVKNEQPDCSKVSNTIAQNCTPNQINKNNLRLNQLSRTKEAYGRYRNVFLEDYSELEMEIAELDTLIEDLSAYMQSTGRKYADHAATLRSWSARKKRQQKPGAGIPDYTYNKEESL